ncbi:hypothetical protein ASPFODRAFT_221475 [Aspergillus luchuensis CBS 106.47]|uniref:Uncharacterized protein n=1 Tax=Aspergillus luchuensis (strain CBS 106.47) TaxID=1137211 RepID=A0A1M3T9T5_ASPLC|nr:hypothetical protein ASPFODRAFT_221475 [Aspergillus luchuensis CBS 106.47]
MALDLGRNIRRRLTFVLGFIFFCAPCLPHGTMTDGTWSDDDGRCARRYLGVVCDDTQRSC